MPHQKGSKRALAPCLAICTAVCIGCAPKVQPPERELPTVKVSQPRQQTVTEFLEETGATEAVGRVDVRARLTGFLEQVNFEAGARVNQGDVLYVIEPRPFIAERKAAEATLQTQKVELNRAEIEYQRELKLKQRNASSDTELLAAQTERDAALAAIAAAEAALDQAKLDEEYTQVRAPISGRVGKTLVKLGNLVEKSAATHLTTVVSYDPIYANFNISERALLKLRERRSPGDENIVKEQIRVLLGRATDPGFPFEGHFDYADLAVDQGTGTYAIRAIFPNPNLDIVPGLFVRIRVLGGQREGLLFVPELAIGADQAGRYVLVVNPEDEVERREVTVGSKYRSGDSQFGDMVVVEEGLQPDDRVIIVGLQRARPGAKVRPEPVELPAVVDEIEAARAKQAPTRPPAAVQPSAPVGAQPTTPVEAQPSMPAASQPSAPAGVQPTTPVEAQPAVPAGVQPTAPASVQPTTPVGAQPSMPAQAPPSMPTEAQPTTPAGVQPSPPPTAAPPAGQPTP